MLLCPPISESSLIGKDLTCNEIARRTAGDALDSRDYHFRPNRLSGIPGT